MVIGDEEVIVVHQVKSLLHLGPVYVPQNPDTIVWFSHLHPHDLPNHLKPLARHWHDNRPTRTAAPGPQARAHAKPNALIRPPMEDVYPPGFGLSSAELDEGAFLEAAARRMRKWSRRAS